MYIITDSFIRLKFWICLKLIFFECIYFNYSNYVGYEEAKVKTSIFEGFPAIVGGISNEKAETRSSGKEKGGHAWVVDGWMERSRTMIRRGSDGWEVVVKTESQQLVHCNWGWNSWYDGYFHSGSFGSTTCFLLEFISPPAKTETRNITVTLTTDEGETFSDTISMTFERVGVLFSRRHTIKNIEKQARPQSGCDSLC